MGMPICNEPYVASIAIAMTSIAIAITSTPMAVFVYIPLYCMQLFIINMCLNIIVPWRNFRYSLYVTLLLNVIDSIHCFGSAKKANCESFNILC